MSLNTKLTSLAQAIAADVKALFTGKADRRVVSADSTTAHTLALTDGYVRMTNGAATTVTVPPQSMVAWPDDTEIFVEQGGNGQVTIAAGAGVTINSPGTLLLVI